MQFLLTNEEYRKLLSELEAAKVARKETVQKLCTMVADNMPVPRPWADDKTPAPWGCILSDATDPGYCDDCPVSDDCPNDYKKWSK